MMTEPLVLDATQKILDGGGNIDRYLMLVFAVVAWWFVRKNIDIVQKSKDEVSKIHEGYAEQIKKLNESHDVQIERINANNLQSIEKIMDKFATERAAWGETQREFTASIMSLSQAIEKRKTPLEFHNEPPR